MGAGIVATAGTCLSGAREGAAASRGGCNAPGVTDAAYFDALYASNDDPWRMATRWYEARKRAILGAMLPKQRYARIFEPGCANGLFSEWLAQRCDDLVASDLNARAVGAARRRLSHYPGATVLQGALPADLPDGRFDLIVVGELGYYFHEDLWALVVARLCERLTPDGAILACHWKHAFDARLIETAVVHGAFSKSSALYRQCLHDEPDFLAELWSLSDVSVAQNEGLR